MDPLTTYEAVKAGLVLAKFAADYAAQAKAKGEITPEQLTALRADRDEALKAFDEAIKAREGK